MITLNEAPKEIVFTLTCQCAICDTEKLIAEHLNEVMIDGSYFTKMRQRGHDVLYYIHKVKIRNTTIVEMVRVRDMNPIRLVDIAANL